MNEGGEMIKNLPLSKEGQNESMSERIMLVICGCYIAHQVDVLNKMIASGDMAKMIPAGFI